jgi:prophage tail gpP-like protein
MSSPTPGAPYVVQPGDTLSDIATMAYGDPREWRRIWNANKNNLRSGKNPNLVAPNGKSGADLIFPGEVLNLPGAPPGLILAERELAAGSLPGRDLDDFALLIDGVEVPVTSAKVMRACDTLADGFTAVVAWDPAADYNSGTKKWAKKYAELLRPFKYQKAEVYLGGVLVLRGFLYGVERIINSSGFVAQLEGWSATVDAVDSVCQPPYEVKKQTLKQRATDLFDTIGVAVEFELKEDEPFDKITASDSETIFSHILKLVQQRGALLTCTPQGDARIFKPEPGEPDLNSTAPGTDALFTKKMDRTGYLEDGKHPVTAVAVKFDGRMRFNAYTAVNTVKAKGRKKSKIEGVAKDPRVTKTRFTSFDAPDTTSANILKAAEWERTKRLSEAMAAKVEVSSWYIPNTDKLWAPGEIVTIQSATLFVPDGFDFMVRSVDFSFGPEGMSASLDLLPPNVYTGEEIKEPW